MFYKRLFSRLSQGTRTHLFRASFSALNDLSFHRSIIQRRARKQLPQGQDPSILTSILLWVFSATALAIAPHPRQSPSSLPGDSVVLSGEINIMGFK